MSAHQLLPFISGSKKESFSSNSNWSSKSAVDDYALCQKYSSYIAQLRGLLEETTGQPPAGVSTAETERRVALIQSALDEVKRRHAEVRWQIELRHNERYLNTCARRMQAEEEAERKRQYAEKQRREQVESMRDVQVTYYRSRNDRIDSKAQKCRVYTERVQEETVERAGSNEERRRRNLSKLAAERRRKQQELREREQAKQAYASEVRERRAAQIARDQEEKALLAEIHQQEMEMKLTAIRESKKAKWMAKREASCAKSKVVWENGKAILETVLKDHDKLIEELNQRQKQQEERYADNKAEREAYLLQRAQNHSIYQERQQEALRRLIELRVSRGEEIVKKAEEKKEKAEKAKLRQATQFAEAGRELDEDIVRHQMRARRLQQLQHNAALRQNYRRWNHRAARIMEELRTAMQEDELPASQKVSPMYRHSQSAASNPERGFENGRRAIVLPSPEEFAF
ncbi:hypothetical protein ABL78_2889 [Leptomonas seymouri]|uniref:Uncharacterized protein n=1 Tax=Leptomonas seymouri TaxID=5684 RepID=A0A0N1ILN1_LEPSE|nr:hypothetical protein ABL78_2889 [Leptomonas seymouri]|eukprot:KPI88013.1 hypothetical protein ABL78_2889 [Leptomonas seymouri]